MSDDLQNLLKDLIATATSASSAADTAITVGKMEAATGTRSDRRPGPALQSVVLRHYAGRLSREVVQKLGGGGQPVGQQGRVKEAALDEIAGHIAQFGANEITKIMAAR